MSKICYTIFFLTLLFCSSSALLNAQSVGELKKQRNKTLDEISLTNKLLAQTSSEKTNTLDHLRLLKSQIKNQEKLIKNLKKEIAIYNSDITSSEKSIKTLQNEVEQLKKEYARIIYSTYTNKHDYDKWLFILSSQDFNQAYRRLKYLEQYGEYREQQVTLIKEKEIGIELKIDSLNQIKVSKSKSLKDVVAESKKLESSRKKENNIYSDLKKRERDLKKELKKKKQNAEQIKKTIENILEAERKRAAANKTKYALTPEEKIISDDFEKNLGSVPWPTAKGIIIGHYGEHPHPVLKGIKTFNSGIDISTEEGSKVRAIFEGEVRDVWSIKGKNMAVIIKHGSYFTVYQNLVEVQVKPGDHVKLKQTIGTIYTDKQEGDNTVLHLEIWKGSDRQNPETWLSN